MKNIAIVTGATGGLGEEFVKLLVSEQVDEVWCIARSKDKLNDLVTRYGDKIRPLSLDLAKKDSYTVIQEKLENEKPNISFLINNVSKARMARYDEFSLDELDDTIDLNCKSMVFMNHIAVRFMSEGSHIINVSSQSSFQPVPYINLYAATKVFEKNYSRALNVELKGTGIHSLACCPGWVATDMLYQEYNGHKTKFKGLVEPDKVARKCIKDAKKNKDMSVYSLYVNWMRFLAKINPHKWVMWTWMRSISKYLVK